MSATSVPAAASFLSLLLAVTALPAQNTGAAPESAGISKVRIVRLSEVSGVVQVDRRTGQGFEAALANLPIVEQSSLRTGNGIAEVEFEDNSTLRLAPYSVAQFPQLERLANGTTVSEVRLLQGTAYVSLEKTRGNEFALAFGQQKLELQPASHVRLQVDQAGTTLAVLGGSVHIDETGGAIDVPRKETISFVSQDASEPKVTKQIASEPFDSWDRQSAQDHARVATFSALGNAPYAYGLNDMAYYGSFIQAGGCGEIWRPYFASAAWEPYANGTWAWYQGAGYSWVSPYPWGWMPYHYGSWSYCQGAGWGWMPGGAWNGLNNVSSVAGGASGVAGGGSLPVFPHPPIRRPRLGQPTLIEVDRKPLVVSNMSRNDSFVFRRDSAGLGVPRDGLGRLNGFSHSAVRQGMASTRIFLTVGPSARPAAWTAGGGIPPSVTVHRGSAPSPMMSSRPGSPGNASQSSTTSALGSTSSGRDSFGGARGGGQAGGGAHAGGGGSRGR